MTEYMYRVDYMSKDRGWQPYFIAESPEAAKAYFTAYESTPRNWYTLNGVLMTRTRRENGTYSTMRIVRNSVVTMKEVETIRARKAAREAKAS